MHGTDASFCCITAWQVLFVGEALVGNDAVDQLSKFNQRLADLSTAPEPRAIDGILLTKFDTIDDKVSAAAIHGQLCACQHLYSVAFDTIDDRVSAAASHGQL